MADLTNLDPSTAALLRAVTGLGLPITITSGHRDAGENRAVGGAEHSQHLNGRALDVDVSKLSDPQKQILLSAAVANGARGFGLYQSGNALHLDTRDTPAVWGRQPGAPYAGMPLSMAPDWAQGPLTPLFSGGQPATALGYAPSSNLPDLSALVRGNPGTMTATPDSAPTLSLFQRSALAQRDPGTGAFIDPRGAAADAAPGGLFGLFGKGT